MVHAFSPAGVGTLAEQPPAGEKAGTTTGLAALRAGDPEGVYTFFTSLLLLHCDTVRFHRDCLTIIITPQTPSRTFTDIRGTSLLSFFDLKL